MSSGQIDTVMHENRRFPPSEEFSSRAVIGSKAVYDSLCHAAAEDPEHFWGEQAVNELHWFKPFDKVLEWNCPYAKWFIGGKTNVSYNCLDVHQGTWRKNKAALI